MYTEASYENSLIELFQNMGYSYAYGPSIDRDYASPLYETELEDAIYQLNPSLPAAAITEALYKLHHFENGSLEQKNTVFMDYLQNGVEVSYMNNGEAVNDIVYLIDFAHPDRMCTGFDYVFTAGRPCVVKDRWTNAGTGVWLAPER